MTGWTEADVLALKNKAQPPPKSKLRARGRPPLARGANRTERAYIAHLEAEMRIGDVVWFEFEGMTLKLGPDCRYTPDFAVMTRDGYLEYHEVKGRGKNGKARYEDDAIVKLRVAAAKLPFRFLLVWPGADGGWDFKEI